MKRFATIFGVSIAGLMLAAGPAAAGHGGSVYTGTLDSLNDSGVTGDVRVELNDDASQATVTLNTTGYSAQDLPHAQHIHGTLGSSNACPGPEADSNGDGVITVAEGASAYGGVQVSLTTSGDTSPDSALAVERYPTGNATYTRTFDISDDVSSDLANLHVVVHGVDENGNGEYDGEARSSLNEDLPREATLPAACGTLALVPAPASGTGGVATGAGGTATTSATSWSALALGGAALAGSAIAFRRRVTA